MNAGLANLATLKEQILPAALQADDAFDAVVRNIGTGVATLFERHCNRLFGRVVDEIDELPADRAWWAVRRTPLEALTKVEVREDLAAGWVDYGLDPVRNFAPQSGIVEFFVQTGIETSRMRLTYTGGFFWEQMEPTDVDFPTTKPAGATDLPADLLLAWVTQCLAEFQRRDAMGKAALADKVAAVPDAVLLPSVVSALNPYRRMAS